MFSYVIWVYLLISESRLFTDVVRPAKVIMEQKKGSPEVYLTWVGVKKEDFMAVDIVWCKMKPAGYTCSVSASMFQNFL